MPAGCKGVPVILGASWKLLSPWFSNYFSWYGAGWGGNRLSCASFKMYKVIWPETFHIPCFDQPKHTGMMRLNQKIPSITSSCCLLSLLLSEEVSVCTKVYTQNKMLLVLKLDSNFVLVLKWSIEGVWARWRHKDPFKSCYFCLWGSY